MKKMQPLRSLLRLPIIRTKSINFSSLSETLSPNPAILNYLIETCNFSKTRAQSILNCRPHINTLEKPQSVIQFLENLGFSKTHIRHAVASAPQILTSNIEKTLKPKIEFFRDLGLAGSDLGDFISKNSTVLTTSLEKRIIPCTRILQSTLLNDKNNKDLILVIRRSNRILVIPESRLLRNIEFLKSCGIVGRQLSVLLKRQPRIFVLQNLHLRELVSRVLDMGFSVTSRMLVHGVYAVSCLSAETFERKMGLIRSFGFSEKECLEMFRRTPGLLKTSEEKIKLGMEFFLEINSCKRSVLVNSPWMLMLSMEERVIPRYRVLQVLESKEFLKVELVFVKVLRLTEEEFLQQYVAKFKGYEEELLVAYKIHMLDTSCSSEEDEENAS